MDLFPKIDLPVVTVTTTLRGAAPEEVETQVSKRIEEAVNTISGIDDLRSTSAEGISIVAVQFMLDKDPEVGAQEIRDKINRILPDLPKDADPPVIEKVATDASPILNVAVSSPRDLRETTKIVDDKIKKNIESLRGVGQVRFVGDRQRQIQVWLDGEKLYSYNLNVEQVRAALAAQNVEIPGGRVDQGARELSLRTMGRVTIRATSSASSLATVGGRADSRQRHRPRGGRLRGTSLAGAVERHACASCSKSAKQAGTNTLDVIQSIKTADRRAAESTLPPDFKITYTRDQSKFISDSFHAVQEHLILGGILAALIVFLFMRNWRSTIIAGIAIPTSIVATYTLMNAMGFTLDQITMLALVLMVGIVIDDAIVVLENVFRFMEEKKLTPMEAALHGNARHRSCGARDYAQPGDHLPAGRDDERHRRQVHVELRLYGGVRHHGFAARQLHSDSDAQRSLPAALRRGSRHEGFGFFRRISEPYRRMLVWSMTHRWAIVALSLAVFLSTIPLFMMVGKELPPAG